jgi:hypothetical protein
MGKPHPVELRLWVVDHVAEGNTHRATPARFKVSVRFVNDMAKLKAATGGLVQTSAVHCQPADADRIY